MKYDLIITGAHVLDPANGIDGVTSIGIKDGKFSEISEFLDPTESEHVIDATGKYLSPGWFDMHVHVYSNLAFSDPDTIGVLHGVTTMVDAGGAGVWTYQDYRDYWEGQSKTEVYSFLSDQPVGILLGTREDLANRAHTNKDVPMQHFHDIVSVNREHILAIKSGVHTYNGFDRVKDAWKICEAVGLPKYLHIGDIRKPPGIRFTREAMDMLSTGDCFTHVYTGNWGNILDDEGKVLQEVRSAIKRGVATDVGYGGLNFSFKAFDTLIEQGIITDVISSDLQGVNITGPCHSLAHVMSIFLNHGFTMNEIIERVTIRPAKLLGLNHKIGSISPGMPARVTAFDIQTGDYIFRDTKGESRRGESMIVPRWVLMDGEYIESDEAPGLQQKNWSFMPRSNNQDNENDLTPQQIEFVRHLASAVTKANWDDGLSIQTFYKQALKDCEILNRDAANAIYDLLLESRFSVPPGWLMSAMERDVVLHQLQNV